MARVNLFLWARRASLALLIVSVAAYLSGYLLSRAGIALEAEPLPGVRVTVDRAVLEVLHYAVIPALAVVAVGLHAAPYLGARLGRWARRWGASTARTVSAGATAAIILLAVAASAAVAYSGLQSAAPLAAEPATAATAATATTAATAEAQAVPADAPVYTWEEIASHNTAESCWIVVNGKVYDVTSYIDRHPAGAQTILDYCGKDATQAFARYHSASAWQLLEQYFIGYVEGYTPEAAPAQDAQQPQPPPTQDTYTANQDTENDEYYEYEEDEDEEDEYEEEDD